MIIILLIGFYLSLLALEAVTDTLTYKGWTTHLQKFGGVAHITQKILIISSFIFGWWTSTLVILSLHNVLILLLTYAMFNFAFFDLFYNAMLGGKVIQGKTAYWDLLLDKLKINTGELVYTLLRLSAALGASYIMAKSFL